MYDENNKPEDLSDVDIEWSWYTPGGDNEKIDVSALYYKGEGAVTTPATTGK
jgi:hypothetical protein